MYGLHAQQTCVVLYVPHAHLRGARCHCIRALCWEVWAQRAVQGWLCWPCCGHRPPPPRVCAAWIVMSVVLALTAPRMLCNMGAAALCTAPALRLRRWPHQARSNVPGALYMACFAELAVTVVLQCRGRGLPGPLLLCLTQPTVSERESRGAAPSQGVTGPAAQLRHGHVIVVLPRPERLRWASWTCPLRRPRTRPVPVGGGCCGAAGGDPAPGSRLGGCGCSCSLLLEFVCCGIVWVPENLLTFPCNGKLGISTAASRSIPKGPSVLRVMR